MFPDFLKIRAPSHELVKQKLTNRCGGEKRDSDLRDLWFTILSI